MTKILLVEDDVSLRDIYFARFESEGFTVAVASNGEEALAAAVKEKPDLILLDIMMPRISGFDVLDIIRTTPETANTRVIMMTALSDPESKEKGQRLGVNQFLVKSQVTLDDIVAAVKKELATPQPTTKTAPKETSGEPIQILGAPKNPNQTVTEQTPVPAEPVAAPLDQVSPPTPVTQTPPDTETSSTTSDTPAGNT